MTDAEINIRLGRLAGVQVGYATIGYRSDGAPIQVLQALDSVYQGCSYVSDWALLGPLWETHGASLQLENGLWEARSLAGGQAVDRSACRAAATAIAHTVGRDQT